MVRLPESCDQKLQGGAAVCDLKKGPWTPEEDQKLVAYIQTNGHGSWRTLPRQAGLARCGKSCRLRWSNYLRPGIKRGGFSPQEDDSIIQLHALLGNRWSTIATHLPGRTDNEIKNHWNTKLRKRLMKMGIDPTTHRPCLQPPVGPQIPSINAMLLSLLQQQPQKYIDSPSHMDSSSILKYLLLQGSLPMNASTFSSHAPPLPNASPSIVGSSPSMVSSLPNIDPTLLNAAQSFLMLEYLRLGSSSHEEHIQPTGLDYQLNQAITRLVLVKLLQQQGALSNGNLDAPYPRFDGEVSTNGSIGKGSQLSTQSPMDYLMHDRTSQNMQVAMGTHFPHGSTTMTMGNTNSTYVNNTNSLSPGENCGMPSPSFLTSMNNSAFQQRLLHLFPFLGEIILDSCKSNTNDDLSSNQLPKSTHLDVFTPPCSMTTPTCHQNQMVWPTNEGSRQIASSNLPFFSGFSTNLMPTWDVPSLSGMDGSKDVASSSTIKKTSSSSTISSASTPPTTIVTPCTPSTNNISNVQDYWSSLLNLFSPNTTHQS